MKVRKNIFRLSALTMAAMSVFSVASVRADEEEAAALKYPASTVEVEEIYVSAGSQKFGEYNGLNKQGGYLNGNINVRGGGAYKKNEEGDTSRWSIIGTNLGLTDRSASVGYSDQGDWGAKLGYDELQHNLAPGYQTPYGGGMGSNSFYLPSNWGTATNTNQLTPVQRAAFANQDISSTRQNTSVNASKIINSEWMLDFDFNHLNQSGAKLQGMSSNGLNGGTTEAVSILPSPTNYQTDTMNAGAHWKGENAHASASYFGSFFRDGTNGVNWQSYTGGSTSPQIMSTAPSNQLQQLNLNGGYDFSRATKLAGNFSFSRNTQNTVSAVDVNMLNAVAPAFNGLVNTSHADLKLTDSSIKDLHLAAGFKYDGRDNLSQSNIQSFQGLGGASQNAIYPNTPLSYKKAQIELAGDYKLSQAQKLQLVYQNQYLNRYCNQYAVGPSANPNSTGYFPSGADCTMANYSRTNNLNALYKLKASDSVDVKLGYGVSIRQTTWNQGALTDFSQSASFYGRNGGGPIGYMPFFEASQNQNIAKANVNWQAAEDLSFGLGGKWTYSVYPDSVYGVKNGTVASLNLDSTYQYAEAATLTGYIVQQLGQRNMTNMGSNGTIVWANNMQENDTTFGLGVKHGGLFADHLSLMGDLTYSMGRTGYSTQYVGAVSCNQTGSCGSPAPITNNMASLKLGGEYKVDKHSKIGLRYIYQHLSSSDYYYTGLQANTTPSNVLPTNQTNGSYNVNVIAASYTYTFD